MRNYGDPRQGFNARFGPRNGAVFAKLAVRAGNGPVARFDEGAGTTVPTGPSNATGGPFAVATRAFLGQLATVAALSAGPLVLWWYLGS